MSRILQDVRHAFRATRRSPLVSILAVIAFALGIGVTTTVFSIFYGVLLKPLPYPRPDELVMVYDTQPACNTCPASFPKYHDWKSRNQVFSAIGGSSPAGFVMSGRGDPVQVAAMRTTASLVDVFGVSPAQGRWFSEAEDQPGSAKVAVLSHGFALKHFHANVIGTTLTLNGEPHEVIGVMPEHFSHRRAEIFVPLARKLDPATRGSHFLQVMARLKPGVTLDRASTEMRALGQSLSQEFGHNHGIDVRSYREAIVGAIRPQLRMLLGAVLAVLLIGCANVANLLLAAGLARRRELGIRLALGARTSDLARQLIAESTILAVAGGAVGILLAIWLLSTFIVLAGNQLPRATTIAIDGRVLGFSAAVTALVGLFCGIWPLFRMRTKTLATAVREGDLRTTTGGRQFGNGLVVVEIALAFALLVGGALLVKNLMLLQSRDAGITTERVITFDLVARGAALRGARGVRTLLSRPAVAARRRSEAFSTSGSSATCRCIDSAPTARCRSKGNSRGRQRRAAGGVPLVLRRLLQGARDPAGARAGCSTRATATARARCSSTRRWGRSSGQARTRSASASARGQTRASGGRSSGSSGDIRSFGLAGRTPYEFYRNIEQQPADSQTVVIRATTDDPSSLIPTARQIVRSLDSALPVTGVQTMEEVVAASVGQQRLISAMAGVFALLAALLAMVGVFGVMTYNVRRQRREIGIRLALGAERAAVRRLILTRGLRLAALGSLGGALGAYLLTGTLQTMLDDVTPNDPLVFGGTAVAVLIAAMLASYLPALSAGKTDPMIVLRDS